ncbi:MAG TPA: hypothetical protein VGB45_14760 [Abditibacterium sp.]|jgi:hypothetical protein
MSPQLQALFLKHGVLSHEKQLYFGEMTQGRAWNFSMDTGKLTFAKRKLFDKPIEFAAQLIGTSSVAQGAWLWAWANEESAIPSDITKDSLRLRDELGDDAPEWKTPGFPIDLSAGQDAQLVYTACGMLGADATFRGATDGGGAYFLLHDHRLKLPPTSLMRVGLIFPQALTALALADHRAALQSYAEQRQIECEADEQGLLLKSAGQEARVKFDEANRMMDWQANLSSL